MSGAGEKAGAKAPREGDDELSAVELVAVARVAKPRGLKGEVASDLLTDFPERFEWLEELIAVFPSGERKTLALEDHWFHAGRVILKFKGFDSPEEAAALAGCELTVPESETVELEEGEFFDWQLQGCRVETVEGREVGTVREVLHTGGEANVLVIHDEKGKENLVPLAKSICVEIDIAGKLIRVDAPEGLLEF